MTTRSQAFVIPIVVKDAHWGPHTCTVMVWEVLYDQAASGGHLTAPGIITEVYLTEKTSELDFENQVNEQKQRIVSTRRWSTQRYAGVVHSCHCTHFWLGRKLYGMDGQGLKVLCKIKVLVHRQGCFALGKYMHFRKVGYSGYLKRMTGKTTLSYGDIV